MSIFLKRSFVVIGVIGWIVGLSMLAANMDNRPLMGIIFISTIIYTLGID